MMFGKCVVTASEMLLLLLPSVQERITMILCKYNSYALYLMDFAGGEEFLKFFYFLHYSKYEIVFEACFQELVSYEYLFLFGA